MATKAQILGGLQILAKYIEEGDPCFMAAEHDQIYCGAADKVSAEDRAELEKLGWFEDADSFSRFV